MNDFLRESFSYFELYRELKKVQKKAVPVKVSYGEDPNQYFYYYEPDDVVSTVAQVASETESSLETEESAVSGVSDKVVVWIHGGGWNAGAPKDFDYIGQKMTEAGYRFISLGYRLSPKNKYPAQIEDVCTGYNRSMEFLKERGIDVSKTIVCGPSAGAHLASILTYSKDVQKTYGVDVSNVIGFVGWGGPYVFHENASWVVRTLLIDLFSKEYDRKKAEPVSLISESRIPMLLIQSRHDGVIDFACAEEFRDRAKELGIPCELYEVVDRQNTHSWYTAGMFL